MSEQAPEVQTDADNSINEQTPLAGTITLRPTPAGYRVNLTKAGVTSFDTMMNRLRPIAEHATDGSETYAQDAMAALEGLNELYQDR